MQNVMSLAWAIYRKRFAHEKFSKKFFAVALKSAWMTVKADWAAIARAEQMVADMHLQGTN